MKIDINEIFRFYELRIKSHVAAVNYFASLLGYHFPEHDNDKVSEQIRTGYAYIFYKTYHKNFHISKECALLGREAQDLHHYHSPHHIQYYKSISEIPLVRVYEMVADWASANFEQKDILLDPSSVTIEEWFKNNMANLDWTPEQLKIINDSFQIIHKNTDDEYIRSIWKPLLEASDL